MGFLLEQQVVRPCHYAYPADFFFFPRADCTTHCTTNSRSKKVCPPLFSDSFDQRKGGSRRVK